MPSHSETRTFHATMEDVQSAAEDALTSLGAEIAAAPDDMAITGRTGWSMFSFFGERVRIELHPSGDDVRVSVTSEQSRGQLLDLSRRNEKNVGTILNSMETRLRS
jgi:hypothetical protein